MFCLLLVFVFTWVLVGFCSLFVSIVCAVCCCNLMCCFVLLDLRSLVLLFCLLLYMSIKRLRPIAHTFVRRYIYWFPVNLVLLIGVVVFELIFV